MWLPIWGHGQPTLVTETFSEMKLFVRVFVHISMVTGDWRDVVCDGVDSGMQHLTVAGRCQVLDIAGIFLCICDLDIAWNRCWTDINSQSDVTWLTLEAGACMADVWRLRPDLQQVDWSSRHIKACWARARGHREAERTVVGRENWCNNFLFYITSFLYT